MKMKIMPSFDTKRAGGVDQDKAQNERTLHKMLIMHFLNDNNKLAQESCLSVF